MTQKKIKLCISRVHALTLVVVFLESMASTIGEMDEATDNDRKGISSGVEVIKAGEKNQGLSHC